MTELIIGALALASIPANRAAIKAYRAKKSVGNIVADAVEAAIDEVDKKKR